LQTAKSIALKIKLELPLQLRMSWTLLTLSDFEAGSLRESLPLFLKSSVKESDLPQSNRKIPPGPQLQSLEEAGGYVQVFVLRGYTVRQLSVVSYHYHYHFLLQSRSPVQLSLFTLPFKPWSFSEPTYENREHMKDQVFLQSSSRSATAATMPNTAIPPHAEVCLAAAAFEVLVPTTLFPGPQFWPKHTPGVDTTAPATPDVVGVAVITNPC
jgi:hypothetical protein